MAIITGTNDPETLPGTKDDDTITGGLGNDTLLGLGGNDIFIWNPGDGSDVTEGGTGNDTLHFNGSNANEIFDISGAKGHALLHRDVGVILIDMNDVERLELQAAGGSDQITVGDLTGTDLKQVAIDLSAAGSPGVGDGALDFVTLNGGNANNTFTLTLDAGLISITGQPASVTILGTDGDALSINGLGGNDTINAAALPAGLMSLTVDGGIGNDTIVGGQGADFLIGNDGNDTITGGRGEDVAFLGAGADRFIWNPGDGSDVVEGQGDTDTLAFNGSNIGELFDISANGGRVRFTRDVGAITMDLNDVERIELHALGGIDRVTVNDLAGTDAKDIVIDLAAALGGTAPDGQSDSVTVNGTSGDDTVKVASSGSKVTASGLAASVTVDHSDKTDIFLLEAGAGNDAIDASKVAAGKLSLQIHGGSGNDILTGGAGDDTVIGQQGNDTVALGGGNDVTLWNPGDGSDTIDGGAGNDTLIFNGANIAEKINIAANLGHALFTRDVANITADLDGIEAIVFNALGGADTISVHDLSGTDVKQVLIDLAATIGGSSGDGAADDVAAEASAAANAITLKSDPLTPNTVVVTGLPEALTVANAEVGLDELFIDGLGGNDKIDASALAGVLRLTLRGGAGNDTIFGSQDSDTLFGGDNNDTVDGGRGDDVAFLGNGDDRFIWNPGDGNDTVEGDDGTDTLVFNGANINESIDLSANGARLRLFRDVASIVMDTDNLERVEIHALGGADTITVNDLTGTDVTSVLVDLAAANPGSATDKTIDTVVMNASTGADSIKVTAVGSKVVVSGLAAEVSVDHLDKTDILTVNGLAGADTIDASKLAAGKVVLRLNGGDDGDLIIGSAGDDLIAGQRGNDTALMGAGNDTFTWNPGDGNDIVEGQAGTDTLDFHGANIAEKINISANGGRALFTRDVANIVMDLNDVERIVFSALGGADSVNINDLTGTDVKQVVVDLAGVVGGSSGDGASDTVNVNGGTAADTFVVSGATGAPVISTPAVQVSILNMEPGLDQIFVNGLGGTDTLRFNGTAGDDVGILFANGGTPALFGTGIGTIATSGIERIELAPGGGSDSLTVGDLTGTGIQDVAIDLGNDGKADTITIAVPSAGELDIDASGSKVVVDNGTNTTIEHWDKSDTLILVGTGIGDFIDASLLPAGKIALEMFGGNGNDSLFGGAGNDTMFGNDGNDFAAMGAGNDSFVWNIGDDNDTVDGGTGTDTLVANGSAGFDLFFLGANKSDVELTYGFGAETVNLSNVERIEINAFSEQDGILVGDLTGTAVKQVVTNLGATPGIGDGFADSLSVQGGEKNESISLGLSGSKLTITGMSAQVIFTDIGAADHLQVNGGAGNDSINSGALKADSVQLEVNGDTGNDTLTGGAGADTLFGGDDNDTVRGGAGDDFVSGGSGRDNLDGGAGNDTILGGAGDDTITGGLGEDLIRYTSTQDGHDTVNGFDGNATGGQDHFDLDVLFDMLNVASADRAGRVSITDTGSSVEIAVDADGNTGNGFELHVATLKTVDVVGINDDVLVGTL